MRDIYRFLLALGIAGLFLMPFPRTVVHDALVGTLYIPVLRLEANVLDIIHLRQERDYLLRENARLAALAGQKPFRTLTGPLPPGVVVRPVKFEPSGRPQRIIFDAGRSRGIAFGDVIMAGGALAARVSDVQMNSCTGITPFNPVFMVGVMDTRSHVLGTFVGGDVPEVQHVPSWQDVASGDTLISSGLAGLIPPGLPVAVVKNVYKTDKPFLRITARPLYQPSLLQNFVVLSR